MKDEMANAIMIFAVRWNGQMKSEMVTIFSSSSFNKKQDVLKHKTILLA